MKNTTPSSLLPSSLLLLPLLVLLMLAPGPGGYCGSALALDCFANTSISGPNDVANLITSIEQTKNGLSTSLYLHPEQGFRGISVVVAVNGSDGGDDEVMHTAWFSLEKACFQGRAEWWELSVTAMIHSSDEELSFIITTGGCIRVCEIPGALSSVVNLQVRGHGPSKWKFNRPQPHGSCNIVDKLKSKGALSFPNCTEPPALSTATPTQCPANIPVAVVVALAVGTVAGVMMVVMAIFVSVVRACRRRTVTAGTATVAYCCPSLLPPTSAAEHQRQETNNGDVDNFVSKDVEPVYEEISIYLTPLPPPSGVSKVLKG